MVWRSHQPLLILLQQLRVFKILGSFKMDLNEGEVSAVGASGLLQFLVNASPVEV